MYREIFSSILLFLAFKAYITAGKTFTSVERTFFSLTTWLRSKALLLEVQGPDATKGTGAARQQVTLGCGRESFCQWCCKFYSCNCEVVLAWHGYKKHSDTKLCMPDWRNPSVVQAMENFI